ncbi:ABC transporter ATP-binding protein [Kribbella sp. NPDC056861]|uniref:ABC transporter ATP-binding protein n=1 Tax=Kribbella sp. NPDC056861 TaxID=3154857 RepID=UPI003434F9C9
MVPVKPLLEVTGLELTGPDGLILRGTDLRISAGEVVVVTGPSGSGKTTLVLAALGHLRDGVRCTAGRLTVEGQEVLPERSPGLRGRVTGYVGQDPAQSLSPYLRIGDSLLQATGERWERADRPALVRALLRRVGLRDLGRRYPHELSGGQLQRVVLAAALARDPRLLVLDEPTTALDLQAKAEVVAELRKLAAEGVAMLWITHDLDSVRGIADRVVELADGRIVHDRETASFFADRDSRPTAPLVERVGAYRLDAEPVLRAEAITAGYARDTPVLREVDLQIRPGECLAILGISGAGKSTLARVLAGHHRPDQGRLFLSGHPLPAPVRRRTRSQLVAVQLVGQDPAGALHPRQTVGTALIRPLITLRALGRQARHRELTRLLTLVGLLPELAQRFPGELSGGQRQRVAIARALAAQPSVLICDEVTSALDADTQAGVLRTIAALQAELGVAVVLISHDPEVVAAASDRVMVLSGGRIVHTGASAQLLPSTQQPHEHVRRLLAVTGSSADYQGVIRP